MKFVGPGTKGVPIWLAVTYLSSNVVLNSLKKPEPKDESEGKEANGEVKPGNIRRRRRSSIVLEVVDGLERDEKLQIMMDGAMEMDGRALEGKSPDEQKRVIKNKMEEVGKSTALQDGAAAARNDTRRR
jgi:hypothetical protein